MVKKLTNELAISPSFLATTLDSAFLLNISTKDRPVPQCNGPVVSRYIVHTEAAGDSED